MNTDQAKSWFWNLLNVFLVGAIIAMFSFLPSIFKTINAYDPMKVMYVSAEGKATVSPDIARVTFSVLSRGVNPETLAKTNNEKMNAVLKYVKEQKIEEKDIKTTGYNLQPDYRYEPETGRSSITGYTLTQTVEIKVRQLDKVATIVGGLTPLGVNQIQGISFELDDQDQATKIAREDAIKHAREKAESMAAASGITLGKLVNVSESYTPVTPYYRDYAMGMGAEMKSAIPAPTLQPGEQQVTVTVNLTYELK